MALRTTFRLPPTGVLSIFDEVAGDEGRVELDNAIYAGDGEWFEFVTLLAGSDVSAAAIASHPVVSRIDSEVVDPASNARTFLVLAEETDRFVVTTLTGNGAVPLRVFLEDGSVTVTARFRDWNHFRALADEIEDRYATFELLETSRVEGIGYPLGSERLRFVIDGKLAEEHLLLLEVAYRMGFFEIPQEANGGQIAEELSVSQSAVSEKLRRAHRELCEFLFGTRSPESVALESE